MFACKACAGSDPTQDTVKFDAAALLAQQQQQEREAAERRAAEECRAAEEAEAAELRRLEEEKLKEQELQRQLEEDEARRRAEDDHARRELEEQIRREEEERQADRLAAEQQERERSEREAAEARARKAAVESFLKEHGFKGGVSGAKKAMMSATYPLHLAAKEGNARMIEMLLKEGADAAQKNSSGKTAAQIAEKSNKSNSHAAVIRALAGGRGGAVAVGVVGGC